MADWRTESLNLSPWLLWTFEDLISSVADESGNGRTGTVAGGGSLDTGQVLEGQGFSVILGSTGRIELDSNSGLGALTTGGCTFEIWLEDFNLTTQAQLYGFILGTDDVPVAVFNQNTAGTADESGSVNILNVADAGTGSNGFERTTSLGLNNGARHHLVIQHDTNGTATTRLRLWLDGTEITLSTVLSGTFTATDPSNGFIFGARRTGASSFTQHMQCTIGGIAVYDFQLSEAQIQTLFDAGTTAPGIEGSGSLTDAGESFTSTGEVEVEGSGAFTDGGDTFAGAGEVEVEGSGSLTDAGGSFSATGEVEVEGTGSLTDAGETFTGTGRVALSGTGTLTDGGETFTGTGEVEVEGSGAFTDAGESFTATGEVEVEGSGAFTDGGETFSGTGEVGDTISGSGSLTDGGESFAGTGEVEVEGTGAFTDGGGTFAGAGEVEVEGSGAFTDAGGTFSGEGVTTDVILGTGSITDGGESFAGTGETVVQGTGNLTDGGGTFAGAGETYVSGTGELVDGGGIFAGMGEVEIEGSGSLTDAGGTFSGSGLELPEEEEKQQSHYIRLFTYEEIRDFVPVHLQSIFIDHKQRHLFLRLQGENPTDPPPGGAAIWVSDGTDTGDEGDVIMKYTDSDGNVSADNVILDADP